MSSRARCLAPLGIGYCALVAFPGPAQAQHFHQWFEVTPEPSRATVGDPVTIRFRLRLDERDLLFDTVPRPPETIPPGVRVLSVEKLHRGADRIFTGQARVAFYRPGRQPVPIFTLPFMRSVKGITRGTVSSDSASIEIVPVLAAGNPSLRDIKELDPEPDRWLPRAMLAALATLLIAWYLAHRRRRNEARAPSPEPEPEAVATPPDPYEIALSRLAEIEHAAWPARGETDRHYEATVDVLRDYLASAEELPARERTTTELLWSLPPRLAEGGLRRRAQGVLGEADLVKFARRRPDPTSAHSFLSDARDLLQHWRRSNALR
jgi:hypothetical protein